MNLQENINVLKDNIVNNAVALRTAQTMRLRTEDKAHKEAFGQLEFLARKKLNDSVDLFVRVKNKLAAPVDAPEAER